MTTPEQARELAEFRGVNVPVRMREALLDLARQVEELQADAGRYRWLKANADTQWLRDQQFQIWFDVDRDGESDSLDAAIDAARNAK